MLRCMRVKKPERETEPLTLMLSRHGAVQLLFPDTFIMWRLTPWIKVLFDKLSVYWLAKKFAEFYVNRQITAVFARVPHLSLAWHSVRIIPSCFFKIHINNTLPSTPSYFLTFPHQNPFQNQFVLITAAWLSSHETQLAMSHTVAEKAKTNWIFLDAELRGCFLKLTAPFAKIQNVILKKQTILKIVGCIK